jgi:serine/threonine protein kinase/Tol biopolymer transport system component
MQTSKATQGAVDSPATADRQIGHYRVTARIGKGGMGEVWSATDTKLGREVAIKLLPGIFAGDSIRLARVRREAQLLASLNYPGIAAIYGIEENTENGAPALVMELVEGPTLADRIAAGPGSPRTGLGPWGGGPGSPRTGLGPWGGGPIPVDEALPILRQIAEALEFAHERGIVHRDLKPANIKITPQGQVKVLDFGLAKAMAPDEASADISNSPTLSLAMTEAGLLLGTAAYMAPEQAKAKHVDRRADIWAFGCVAYEMLTSHKAFDGETISDVLAAIIKGEPDWSALPATTPASIQRLLRRCLQKDVRQRLQAMGDARIAIEEALAGGAESGLSGEIAAGQRGISGKKSHLRRALPWALSGIAFLSAAAAAWLLLQPKPQPGVIRFHVPPPENLELLAGGELSLSPDGRNLVFVTASGASTPQALWLRSLDSLTAHQIPGTEGGFGPFWSPDSQQIGFFTNGKLEKISVTGGAPQTLCDTGGYGATWNREGIILFAGQGGLYSVPDTGGAPTLVLAPDPARHEASFSFTQFLPDGRHFIFRKYDSVSNRFSLEAGSLDSKQVEDLGPIGSNALYAPPGYLFYLDQSTLMARPFNDRARRFTGPAVPEAQNVGFITGSSYGYFSVSAAGVLAFQVAPAGATNQMAWYGRTGQKLGTAGQPNLYTNPALAPDGSRLAVGVGPHGSRDIWIYDLKRETASRLTFNPADDLDPAWSADGSRIFFSSNRAGQVDIYQQAANGLGMAQPVFQSKDQNKYLDDVSADGRYLLYDTGGGANGTDLWALPLFGDRKPFAFVQGSSFGAHSARFSPNGRFVAYDSNETGKMETYVQTFPQQTGKWQISPSGGLEAFWRRDGKELFYLTPDNQLMAVPVNTDAASSQAGIPKPLFQPQLVSIGNWRNIYVPSPDGQRFLMLTPASEAKPEPITVVVNWPALLRQSGSR